MKINSAMVKMMNESYLIDRNISNIVYSPSLSIDYKVVAFRNYTVSLYENVRAVRRTMLLATVHSVPRLSPDTCHRKVTLAYRLRNPRKITR